jgi:hypothetical protein
LSSPATAYSVCQSVFLRHLTLGNFVHLAV